MMTAELVAEPVTSRRDERAPDRPMPTLPVPSMTNRVDVATVAEEEATTKRGFKAVAFALPTERLAHGVEVPTPTNVPVFRNVLTPEFVQ